MFHSRTAILLIASLGIAACAPRPTMMEGSSSALGPRLPGLVRLDGPVYKTSQYDVGNITVTVPRSLVVSEANLFYPSADIVWHGEPVGDRHAQVEAILAEAAATGTVMMTRGPKVDVEITLVRFHAVTEKTRASFDGVHSMQFLLTVRDPAGAILDGPRLVVAETPAAGGVRARAEDAAGLTQRVVVTARLARAFRSELSRIVPRPADDALILAAAYEPAMDEAN